MNSVLFWIGQFFLLKNGHNFLRVRHAIKEKRWLPFLGLRVDAAEDFHNWYHANPEEIVSVFQDQMASR